MKQLLPLLFLICTLPVFSQSLRDGTLREENTGGSRVEALKIAYLTKKMDLSPDEAKSFWPVYNSYSSEIHRARMDQRAHQTTELETEEKILSIRKKYNTEFSKILSADKVNAFFRSEKDFSNYVQKELSERKQLRQQMQENKNRSR